MNFIIDIGNSLTKVAFFRSNEICKKSKFGDSSYSEIKKFLEKNREPFRTIISTVKSINNNLIDILYKSNCSEIVYLNHKTPLPIKINYKTPETLGLDRIAAVAGANYIFEGQNVLIVDFGTAVTYDLLIENCFTGGNISPGLETRFRSLHDYTGKLPKASKSETMSLLGTDTNSAIIAGVQNGILFETEAYINIFSRQYSDLKVIFTGGDAFFFEKFTKRIIFAEPDLVLIGLNKILEYNLSTQ